MDANVVISAIFTAFSIAVGVFILVIEAIKVIILIKNKIQNTTPTSNSPTTTGLNQVESELRNVLTDTIAPQTSALTFVSKIVGDLNGQKQTPSTSSSGDQKTNE